MKIMQVIPAFRLAGAEIMCENLCVSLHRKGHTVIAVSLYNEESAITKRLVAQGIRIEYLGKKKGLDMRVFFKLYCLIKKENPDVVHTHIYASKYALPVATLAGVKKKIHTVHNMASKESTQVGKLINGIMFRIFAVTPVALSAEIQKTVHDTYRIGINNIPVVFNGIDLSRCLPKEGYDSEDGIFRILHIGRFMDVKNHELLIHAFSEACILRPDLRLQLIGEGKLMEKIQLLAKRLEIDDKVYFLGVQDNVYPFLHNADVFVLPSKYEGMPMTLIEAMGTGLPIIASNVGGILDMIRDRKQGIIINPVDRELRDAILELHKNYRLRKQIGEAARKRSIRFSADRMGEDYLYIYNQR